MCDTGAYKEELGDGAPVSSRTYREIFRCAGSTVTLYNEARMSKSKTTEAKIQLTAKFYTADFN